MGSVVDGFSSGEHEEEDSTKKNFEQFGLSKRAFC